MQTPGRRVESLTPMIAINRRIDTVFERLTKVEEDFVEIERPQQRMFGRILNQFQSVNNSMETMEDLIRQDIAAKRKYFREETKILEKDSRNLQGVRAGFGRQLAAGALGAYGVSQILQGNLGEGAAGIGGAAALLTPEILGVISSVVTTRLVKSGILGRGRGIGTMGTRVAGASKLKNPLLITAALAASFILPGLINSNQNADRRRQLDATRVIRGAETINKPDVQRFRAILSRFDSILSSISLERKRKGKGILDEELIDEAEDNNNNNNNNIPNDEDDDIITKNDVINDPDLDPSEFAINEATGKVKRIEDMRIDERAGFEVRKFFENLFKRKNEKDNKDVSMINNSITGGDVNQTTNVAMGDINPNLTNNFTSNLGDLSFDMINNNIANNVGGGESEFIDLTQDNNEEVPSSSGFSAFAASPTFVSISTRFESSSGAIDKFEAAAALRSGVGLV